jgi:pyruvate ferredoxin oxidoreductase gamma subunit
MYRVRFHGRGGQGMKTASRILGTAFSLDGYEVQDAQRYGAERRGAPISAYVRADRAPINERGIIDSPDLVVVADDTLIPIAAAGVLQGIGPRAVVLIDSAEDQQIWRDRLNLTGPILVLSRPEPLKRSEAAYIGAECAGAAAALTGTISRSSLLSAVRRELASMKTETVARNLEIAALAFDRMSAHSGVIQEGSAPRYRDRKNPEWIEVPREDADRSSPTIFAAATSTAVRTGLWRSMRPVVDSDRCNRCTWICGSFCPDGAISRGADGFPQIDLDHCKGCLICVAQCPPHAIEAMSEAECEAREMEGTAA